MALVPVVDCVGGVIADREGKTLHAGSDGRAAAAARGLFDAALAMIGAIS